ncbi:MAG TPA: hypothetical protein VII58_03110, partial [Acidobacteriaceae bacterium]
MFLNATLRLSRSALYFLLCIAAAALTARTMLAQSAPGPSQTPPPSAPSPASIDPSTVPSLPAYGRHAPEQDQPQSAPSSQPTPATQSEPSPGSIPAPRTAPPPVVTAAPPTSQTPFTAMPAYGTPEQAGSKPDPLGSPYIPVDSWVYPAMLRLYSMGYLDTMFLGERPYT